MIPAGEFQMGCSPGDESCYRNEKPLHRVKITCSYRPDYADYSGGFRCVLEAQR